MCGSGRHGYCVVMKSHMLSGLSHKGLISHVGHFFIVGCLGRTWPQSHPCSGTQAEGGSSFMIPQLSRQKKGCGDSFTSF
jgi:hypothetical protein